MMQRIPSVKHVKVNFKPGQLVFVRFMVHVKGKPGLQPRWFKGVFIRRHEKTRQAFVRMTEGTTPQMGPKNTWLVSERDIKKRSKGQRINNA